MKIPTIQELLKAGAHFGHQSANWNPKMEKFVFTKKEGVYIIDLQKTRDRLIKALEFASKISKEEGKIIFVCTKRQGKDLVKKAAKSCKMPYVTERWLGGTLTNFKTIHRQIEKLRDLEEKREAGQLEKYTKYERQLLKEEIEKLNHKIGGIKNLDKMPEALFVFDTVNSQSTIKEARAKKIPIIALVDSNANPEDADYPIPSNDDAIKIIELMANTFANAIKENSKETTEIKSDTVKSKK